MVGLKEIQNRATCNAVRCMYDQFKQTRRLEYFLFQLLDGAYISIATAKDIAEFYWAFPSISADEFESACNLIEFWQITEPSKI